SSKQEVLRLSSELQRKEADWEKTCAEFQLQAKMDCEQIEKQGNMIMKLEIEVAEVSATCAMRHKHLERPSSPLFKKDTSEGLQHLHPLQPLFGNVEPLDSLQPRQPLRLIQPSQPIQSTSQHIQSFQSAQHTFPSARVPLQKPMLVRSVKRSLDEDNNTSGEILTIKRLKETVETTEASSTSSNSSPWSSPRMNRVKLPVPHPAPAALLAAPPAAPGALLAAPAILLWFQRRPPLLPKDARIRIIYMPADNGNRSSTVKRSAKTKLQCFQSDTLIYDSKIDQPDHQTTHPNTQSQEDSRLIVMMVRKAIDVEDPKIALENYNFLKERHALSKLSAKDYSKLIILLASASQTGPGKRLSPRSVELIKSIFTNSVSIFGIEQLRLTMEAFECLLQIFSQSRDYEVFDAVHQALRNSGNLMPVSTLNLIMGTYAKRRDLDNVLRIFNELEALAELNSPDDEVLEPSKSSSPRYGPDATTYLHLVNGYIAAGHLEEAVSVLTTLRQESHPVGPSLAIFNSIIKAFALQGDMERSLSFFEDMQTLGFRPNTFTYNNLMDAYAKMENEVGALRTFRSMMEDFRSSKMRWHVAPNVVSLNILVNMYARSGKPAEAEKVIAAMEGQLDAQRRPIQRDAYTVSALMNCYRRASDMQRCRTVLEKHLKENLVNVVAFNILIHGYTDAGDVEMAMESLDLIADAKLEPNLNSYRPIFELLAKPAVDDRKLSKVRDLYKQMRNDAISPNGDIFASIFEAFRLRYLGTRGDARSSESSEASTDDKPDPADYGPPTTTVENNERGSILRSIQTYVDDMLLHDVSDKRAFNDILCLMLADGSNSQEIEATYRKLYMGSGITVDVSTLRAVLDEGAWRMRENVAGLVDQADRKDMADVLLKVYADLAGANAEVSEEDHMWFSRRIQGLLGSLENVEARTVPIC
ncbi:hypothetical protein HDU97_002873, partial [Phlyctochytrium planicorne]